MHSSSLYCLRVETPAKAPRKETQDRRPQTHKTKKKKKARISIQLPFETANVSKLVLLFVYFQSRTDEVMTSKGASYNLYKKIATNTFSPDRYNLSKES